jgi:uncharacterized protein (TIGR02757 family)
MPGLSGELIEKKVLDRLYDRLNHRQYVHPDPLEFLYPYQNVRDREVVALTAAALAYGRVEQILKSVATALAPMRPSPFRYLENASMASLRRDYAGFVHRFAKGRHIAAMLFGARWVIRTFGSLNACFVEGMNRGHQTTVFDALDFWVGHMIRAGDGGAGHLLPAPAKGSACKRLHLFLRWMVRRDAVDPGGWGNVSRARLIIPLDIHMHRVGLRFGFTGRKQANRLTAEEVTEGFRRLSPDDPVRYDFVLTRLGMRKKLAGEAL